MNEELSQEQMEHKENIKILKCFDMIYNLPDAKRDTYVNRLIDIFDGVDRGIRKVNVAELWANYVKNRELEEEMDANDAATVLYKLLTSTESPPMKRQRVKYSFV